MKYEEWRIEKDPELLPCPFCGGEAAFIDDRQNPYDTDGHVECTQCGARIDDDWELWNNRANPSKETKALKKQIQQIQAQNKKIVERLECEKLFREHIAYSLFCKDERYLQCKSWEECLTLAQKEFDDYYGEKKRYDD